MSQSMSILSRIISVMRNYCSKRGIAEVPQPGFSPAIGAYKDISTAMEYTTGFNKFPLPQTMEFSLESTLLREELSTAGIFSFTTSFLSNGTYYYPTDFNGPTRPKFEFAMKSNHRETVEFMKMMMQELGFSVDIQKYMEELDHNEAMLFYNSSSPLWWNMDKNEDTNTNIVVKNTGIGNFSQKSCSNDGIRESFEVFENGKYAGFLRRRFGHDQIQVEIDDYLNLKIIPRCAGSIDLISLTEIMANRLYLPPALMW